MDQDISPFVLEKEFLSLVKEFNNHNLDYVLIGGLAVAVYGFVRYTKDIDIVIRESELPKFKAILSSLDYIIDNGRLPFPSTGMTFYRMGKFVDNSILSIDMLLEPNDSPYFINSKQYQMKEERISVANIQRLIEMKSKSTRSKDQLDVEELKQIVIMEKSHEGS
ncbi:MAG: hypothetical protein SFY68_07575 [Candidatus Sumerlaeia bacterium]|nr:hypothetical protein [Candidatus Sumerlaeia bacterium]